MNRKIILLKLFIVLGITFGLTGCSIGKSRTYCEENGADYSQAGVCDSMLEILENPQQTINKAYKNQRCGRN